MTAPQLYVDGNAIRIGKRIGKGGEGEVYALADDASRAVKFYTAHDGAAREQKIKAIVNMRLAERSSLVAFPIALARDRNGRFAGFIMHLVREHKPLFELYSPGARKQNFPDAGYKFLVRAALNIARAVTAVHDAGCVIGDINHSGILISTKATAALIDADSFQIIDAQTRYLCRVGVPEYTPPELQGVSLGTVVRTPNHDAFGLAIIIFQLLAMGRHPFVGSYAKGEMPIQKAISEHRFVYSRTRAVGMIPPPGACTLADFPSTVGDLFERAFSHSQSPPRPSAQQWIGVLEKLEDALIKCSADTLHHYSSAASDCPWCRLEKRTGVILFLPSFGAHSDGPLPQIDLGQFNVAQLWARIDAVRLPASTNVGPTLPPLNLSASPDALEAARSRHKPGTIRLASGALGLLLFIALPPLWPLALIAIWFGFRFAGGQQTQLESQFRNRVAITDQEWLRALEQWHKRCGIERVTALKEVLHQAKLAYEALRVEHEKRVKTYQSERETIQRRSYLDRFRIRDQKIHGIGPAKLATLASYGIETAGDCSRDAVLNVPGFGPTNSRSLFEWQQQCARGFVYNKHPTSTDRMELAKISSEIEMRAKELRETINRESQQFFQLTQTLQQSISVPDPRISALHQRRSQLEVDCRHLSITLPPRPTYVPPAPSPQPRATPRAHTTFGRSASPTPRSSTNQPNCPRCSGTMVRRTARRGRNAGGAFWGCAKYPSCRGTRPI